VCGFHRSLSALGNVIQALVSKQAHIPFRDSKLTYLLQDSLGKDNKTLMIVQVNPMLSSRSESVCSLNFAQRVGKVELGKAKSHGDNEELVRTRALVSRSPETLGVLLRKGCVVSEYLTYFSQAAKLKDDWKSAVEENERLTTQLASVKSTDATTISSLQKQIRFDAHACYRVAQTFHRNGGE
jgi:kinesin family member C2/C3